MALDDALASAERLLDAQDPGGASVALSHGVALIERHINRAAELPRICELATRAARMADLAADGYESEQAMQVLHGARCLADAVGVLVEDRRSLAPRLR